MNVLMRIVIGGLKIAATVWVILTVRRYFGTVAVMAEIGRRLAGAMGWSKAFSVLTAVNAVRGRRRVQPATPPQNPA